MARVFKREAGRRDIVAQWVWYADNAGIEIADRFLQAADNTLRSLPNRRATGSHFFSRPSR